MRGQEVEGAAKGGGTSIRAKTEAHKPQSPRLLAFSKVSENALFFTLVCTILLPAGHCLYEGQGLAAAAYGVASVTALYETGLLLGARSW